jgi:hypothetical protein
MIIGEKNTDQIFPHFALSRERKREVKSPCFYYVWWALGVMVSMLTSSAVDRGFEPWSGQTKDYEIAIFHTSISEITQP